MKLIPNIIAKHLPVSRKAHQAALAKSNEIAAKDQSWLLTQLRQATATNIRLERKLHLGEQD